MLKWNMNSIKQILKIAFSIISTIIVLYSCASIGRPDGGPLDETPPKFVGSTPDIQATNVDKKKITILFDEYIKLENANEKVVVSPPQIQQPLIKPSGKKVVVTLEDSLKANTTYTIDFGDAIVDNNEGNPLGDFTFTFSTGNQIDTLAISGTVLAAKDLEPIKNILVGLHENLNDTAFTKEPFLRVARTDSKGEFTIHGIAPGKYRVYALKDIDQNYVFSQKSEWIAYSDSIYIPTVEERIKQDTIWKDSLTVDSIHTHKYTHHLPDDIILKAFEEDFYNQYLIKHERKQENILTLYFAEYPDTIPTIKGLDFDESDLVADYRLPSDTIYNFWVKDSLLYQRDTLTIQLDYLHTDTLNQLVAKTDTLRFTFKHKKVDKEKESKKNKDKKEEDLTPFLQIKPDISSNFNVYDYLRLSFEEPIKYFDNNKIHIMQKNDTLWNEIKDFTFEQDQEFIKQFNIYHEWIPDESYKIIVDSLAFQGIYGLYTNTFEQEFKIKKLEEYGTVQFNISGVDSEDSPIIVELLDSSDKVVRTVKANNGTADFYYLDPGKYSARLIIDKNNNGKWDTGNFENNLQPEDVYYYPQMVEFKANWSANQDWNIKQTPLPKQKLNELKKQKPDDDKKKKTNEERRRRR
ncbi:MULTISPECIES: Ig-like domain-containing domain [Bacteroides]|uniref:Ig-like domain-containing domain n=1 Tax=Bacteroides TaxID=816 RepID=UPI001DE32090|nr:MULTISPECIES: Ig-like domain-containing domain [Bacteroides]HJD93114.1 Ig-like domain-containing protein [Bacteroides coprosuis]